MQKQTSRLRFFQRCETFGLLLGLSWINSKAEAMPETKANTVIRLRREANAAKSAASTL